MQYSLTPLMRTCGGPGACTSRSLPRIGRNSRAKVADADPELIDTVKQTTPARPVELRKLAYTLDRRRADILAYFDHPRTLNGPTEAINGRLEHLRGSALGFRNSRTTSPGRSLKLADSDRIYTLKYDEPHSWNSDLKSGQS